jgi:hypothetical protein
MTDLRSRWLLAAALGAAGLGLAVAADVPDYLSVQDSWPPRIDEPGLDLDRARAQLRRGRTKLAAAEVRQAAAVVADAANRAGGADKARLQGDANALLQVAGEIDAGRIEQPTRFDVAVVPVHEDLGLRHDLQAAGAWARQQTEAAGRSLAAASRMVEGFGAHLAAGTGSAVESEWTRARDTVQAALDDLSLRLGLPHVG